MCRFPALLGSLAAGREALAGPAEGGGGGKCGSDSAAPANTCKQLRAHNGKYRWGTAGAAPSRRRLHQTAGCQEPARPRHRSGPRSQNPPLPPPPIPPFFSYIFLLLSHPRDESGAHRSTRELMGLARNVLLRSVPAPRFGEREGSWGGGGVFLAFYFKKLGKKKENPVVFPWNALRCCTVCGWGPSTASVPTTWWGGGL